MKKLKIHEFKSFAQSQIVSGESEKQIHFHQIQSPGSDNRQQRFRRYVEICDSFLTFKEFIEPLPTYLKTIYSLRFIN
jgi:hypothetical protein